MSEMKQEITELQINGEIYVKKSSIKQLEDKPKPGNPIQVGNKVFIRTVTYFQVGRIVEITPTEIVLADAAWIADTGRFAQCMLNGTANEAEPFAEAVAVSRGSIIDVTLWRGSLPLGQK